MSKPPPYPPKHRSPTVRLFLCGDVMLGRGIDQVMHHPCEPTLHEDYVRSALEYVRIAEAANGPIARPVEPSYVWGAALEELATARPNARIINLETSITRSEEFERKGINYRMSPENAACLQAAGIDCCVLANNHVLDWGRKGLLDTLETLQHLGVKSTGAGRSAAQATAPAVLPVTEGCRVIVYSFASPSSGTPEEWAATTDTAGVNLLPEPTEAATAALIECIAGERQNGDVIVVSIHWGSNWGYAVSAWQRRLAHALIDRAGVSVVHGHSSHHPRAIEVYRNRLILYGCGDFLNDYEGISGYERYRGDLSVMYFVDVNIAEGMLCGLDMVPLQIKHFRLNRASTNDIEWMQSTLDRESGKFGTHIAVAPHGRLAIRGDNAPC